MEELSIGPTFAQCTLYRKERQLKKAEDAKMLFANAKDDKILMSRNCTIFVPKRIVPELLMLLCWKLTTDHQLNYVGIFVVMKTGSCTVIGI